MALSPPTSQGDSQSPSRTSFPFRQRLWPFSHAKPPTSESPPKAPVRTAYVPQHAAADFLRTTTPRPRVLPIHPEGSPQQEQSSRQSRNQGGVVRRIADYVKPPTDG